MKTPREPENGPSVEQRENVSLRKENERLRAEVKRLRAELDADAVRIGEALEWRDRAEDDAERLATAMRMGRTSAPGAYGAALDAHDARHSNA